MDELDAMWGDETPRKSTFAGPETPMAERHDPSWSPSHDRRRTQALKRNSSDATLISRSANASKIDVTQARVDFC